MEFLKAAAELLASVGNAVEREVYGARAAEAAGVSPEVMRLETERAFKRRVRRDAKRQEKIDLAPAAKLQPRSKTIRYDNLKSAMAEEGLLGQILREPALLDRVELEPEEFSCELLGRVYGLLRSRHREGLQVNLSCLEGLTPEESAHLASVAQRQEGPVNETALRDCAATIRREHRLAKTTGPEGLLALRDALREKQ